MDKNSLKRMEKAVKYVERKPQGRVIQPTAPRTVITKRWFWTTGAMTTASITGTTVSTAVLTLGTATARMCQVSTVSGSIVLKPDTTQSDITIYNGTILSASIASGNFFECSFADGIWQVDLSSKCT